MKIEELLSREKFPYREKASVSIKNGEFVFMAENHSETESSGSARALRTRYTTRSGDTIQDIITTGRGFEKTGFYLVTGEEARAVGTEEMDADDLRLNETLVAHGVSQKEMNEAMLLLTEAVWEPF